MQVSKSRLKWACRRGMLELDVLLMPFADNAYDQLTQAQQVTFQRLLEASDPDLFSWFMGHKVCDDSELAAMIHAILQHAKA